MSLGIGGRARLRPSPTASRLARRLALPGFGDALLGGRGSGRAPWQAGSPGGSPSRVTQRVLQQVSCLDLEVAIDEQRGEVFGEGVESQHAAIRRPARVRSRQLSSEAAAAPGYRPAGCTSAVSASEKRS